MDDNGPDDAEWIAFAGRFLDRVSPERRSNGLGVGDGHISAYRPVAMRRGHKERPPAAPRIADVEPDDDAQALLRMVYPHFQRASALKARVRMLESERAPVFTESVQLTVGQPFRHGFKAMSFFVAEIDYGDDRVTFFGAGEDVVAQYRDAALLELAERGEALRLHGDNERIVACLLSRSEDERALALTVIDTQSRPDWLALHFARLGVSNSEYTVLSAYCLGMTIRQIALHRGRSPETVKRQLKGAMAKLGVTRQEDAVRHFFWLLLRQEPLTVQRA